MPSEAPVLPTQTEKPKHYTYLKEFRTQQCPQFLQHKCTQHRPYTCFHWHFLNQRRRRPIRRRDGVFNYSPDVYCTKYDETTGLCPDGDECPYLHRTAGDTERRYHLRYYKTGTCVHETDAHGHCVKNGPHCAFAHGAPDMRPPVYDIRELQLIENGDLKGIVENTAAAQLEKERIVGEDPRWNDTNFVLANYKTEPCKRPPRLCRQGYACPSYHNSRDRRRSPNKYKYRSTPCPNVKHGDDWGDPTQCDSGDSCAYCHTRTEQQFHPEIYKSTKCNDMVQTGYCPRGPFCAFAHVEQEMTTQRELATACANNCLAAFVTSALPCSSKQNGDSNNGKEEDHLLNSVCQKNCDSVFKNNNDIGFRTNGDKREHHASGNSNHDGQSNHSGLMGLVEPLGPIGKGRSGSFSSGCSGGNSNAADRGSDFLSGSPYGRAPGSEREDAQGGLISCSNVHHQHLRHPYMHVYQAKLRAQLQAIEDDVSLDQGEKKKRKQNLLLLHNLNAVTGGNGGNGANSGGVTLGSSPTTPTSTISSTMSPNAPSFYPPLDTVESVIGNALDEDLNLGELSLSSIDRDLQKDNDNDTNSVCSSLSTGFPASSSYFATSVPVTIPSGGMQRNSLGSLSQSPVASPIGSLPPPFIPQHIQEQQKQELQLEQAAAAFLSQPNPGKYSAPGCSDFNSMSPRSGSMSQSPMLTSSGFNAMNGFGEVHRLREELNVNKAKLNQWEEGIAQARNACEAWKKEAEEATRKAKVSEEEKQQLIKQRDEAISQVSKVKMELEMMRGSGFLRSLQSTSELEHLPVNALKQIQTQLRIDSDTVEKIIFQHTAMKCLVCQEKNRTIMVRPCNHFVLCDGCAANRSDCPYCHAQIQHRASIVLPM